MNFLKNTAFIESLNKLNDININDDEKNTYIKSLFETDQLTKHLGSSDKMILNSQIFDDLEIFQTENPVFSHINKTQTNLGASYFKLLLKMPLSNMSHLHNRQTIVKSLMQSTISHQISENLEQVDDLMDDLLWFWKPQNLEMQNLIDIVYFKNRFLKFANNKSSILNFSTYLNLYLFPLFQLISPLIPIFTIFFIMKKADPDIDWNILWSMLKQLYGINSGNKYHLVALMIWALVYLYGTYTVITNAIIQYKIIKLLHDKLYHLTKFKQICRKIYENYKILIKNEKDLLINLDSINDSLNYLDNYLDIDNPSGFFDNKGHSLSSFQKIYQNDEIKRHLIVISQFIGYIDSLISITKLQGTGYSFVNFVNAKRPEILFNGIWHPCLNPKKSVLNNSSIQCNRIITGPNAGGKSTYIKNVALLLLLSHTITIGNCKKAFITPFKLLHSYIHLVDTKGIESLFEAEMNRCFEFIKTIDSLGANQYSFAIFDELFTSTNFYEGVSAAYSICLEFNKYPQLLTLMTTHYSELTELEKATNRRFQNYKVSVKKSPDGHILFNYKIKKGISNQFIALDLLKLKGFNNDIINNAMKYLTQLQLKNKD